MMEARNWWPEWWHGIGSDKRYAPKWWFTRRAYMAGLQDAGRIVENARWNRDVVPHQPTTLTGPVVIKALHDRYLQFADMEAQHVDGYSVD